MQIVIRLVLVNRYAITTLYRSYRSFKLISWKNR